MDGDGGVEEIVKGALGGPWSGGDRGVGPGVALEWRRPSGRRLCTITMQRNKNKSSLLSFVGRSTSLAHLFNCLVRDGLTKVQSQ